MLVGGNGVEIFFYYLSIKMALFVDVNGKMTFLVKPLGTLIINRFSVLLVFVLKGADVCTPKHASSTCVCRGDVCCA